MTQLISFKSGDNNNELDTARHLEFTIELELLNQKSYLFISVQNGTQFFMSKRKDSSWEEWTEPLELETSMYPDAILQYYQVPGDGSYGYFISATKSYGEGDLFRIELKKEEKPNPFVILNGLTLNKKKQTIR